MLATCLLNTGCNDGSSLPTAPERPSLAAGTPAEGQGGKLVFPIHFDFPVTCPNGTVLREQVDGWVQVHIFNGSGNRNLELDVFQNTIVISNSAGQTFGVEGLGGPDRYYLDGDNLILVSAGPIPPLGLTGRIVVNLTTGEVTFIAGKETDPEQVLACAALS